MSGIQGKNTKPELIVRKGLHALGFRFRIHVKDLPGKPDLVLPKHKAVILVNGCFWHGHNCHLFKWPSTRQDFWETKIHRNRQKDIENVESLCSLGWRVFIVWECALKGKTRFPVEQVIETLVEWLQSDNRTGEIRGEDPAE